MIIAYGRWKFEMSYVYQTHHQSVQVELRKRSPLGKFAAWCVKIATGTALERPVSFFASSKIGSLAVAITVSLTLGILFDLAFQLGPNPHSFIVCAILGAIAGGAAQGAGGAIVGALWGWLVGVIADSIVSKIAFDTMGNRISKVMAWCMAVLLGWLAGRITSWCFEKLRRRYRRSGRLLSYFLVVIVFSSVTVLVYELGIWLAAHYTGIWPTVVRWAPAVGRWVLIGVVWIIIVVVPALFLLWICTPEWPPYDSFRNMPGWPRNSNWIESQSLAQYYQLWFPPKPRLSDGLKSLEDFLAGYIGLWAMFLPWVLLLGVASFLLGLAILITYLLL